MTLLKVEPNLESDGEDVWGTAVVDAIGLRADWSYDPVENVIAMGETTIDGFSCPINRDDPMIEKVISACTDAVTAFLGRSEVAAENAKDEATDMAIDKMIEARHGNQEDTE